MTSMDQAMARPDIRAAQIVVPCSDISACIDFLASGLGFRVSFIYPADAPSAAVLVGYGITLRLEKANAAPPTATHLRLLCNTTNAPLQGERLITGPDGLFVELVDANPPMQVPAGHQAFVLTRMTGPIGWGTGRAGMLYRDLIPDRLGGRFIASHIRIPGGGPVADYVHYHRVRFQMIFCRSGWAKLVYEDQGEPFVMQAGDCVLQPPEIRHRVLESSAGLEVIEIGCPAVHETHGDQVMDLPTGRTLPDRVFAGQKFQRHIAKNARSENWRAPQFLARDTGFGAATNGLAGAWVVRAKASPASADFTPHDGELLFWFVLRGGCSIDVAGSGRHQMVEGDSCVIPAGAGYSIAAGGDLEFLEVSLPSII